MNNEGGDELQMPSELELLKRRADQIGVPYSNNIGLDTLKQRIKDKIGTSDETTQDQPRETADEGDSGEGTGGGDSASEEGTDGSSDDDTGTGGDTSEGSSGGAEANGFEAAARVAAEKTTVTEAELQKTEPVVVAAPTDVNAVLAALGLTPELLAQAVQIRDNPASLAGPVAVTTGTAKVTGKVKNLRKVLEEKHMRLIRIRITCMNPQKKDLQGEIFTVANKYLGTVKRFIPFGEATEEGWHVPEILYKMLQRRKYVAITTYKDKQTGFERQRKAEVKEFAIEVLPPLTEKELKSLGAAQAAAGSLNE